MTIGLLLPIVSAFPAPAVAQAVADTQPSVAGGVPKAVAAEDNIAGEIVVTAQRKSERLQDVPISVTALSGDQLARSSVQSTRDLSIVTPGLNFTSATFVPQATIRGIGTRGAAIGDESVVPIFVDGVYQAFMFGAIFDLVGVERTEVLRGPQSTLYGRNATGGAINIVTRTPEAGVSGDVGLRYGRFGMTDRSGYLNVGSDVIATSLAGRWRRDNGYVRDIVTGEQKGDLDNLSVRSKTVLHASDRLDLTLTGVLSNVNDSSGYQTQPINGDSQGARFPGVVIPSKPYEVAQNVNPFVKINTRQVSLTGKLDLDTVNITSVTGYTYGRARGTSDSDGTTADAVTLFFDLNARSVYQEVYASSANDGMFNWTAGAVYFYDDSHANPQASRSTNITPGANFGAQTTTSVFSKVETHSIAGYGELTAKLSDTLKINIGGRYTSERKRFETRSTALNMRTNVTTLVAPDPNSKTWGEFTPSGTITYQPSRDYTFYAKAAKGFKSGIFNTSTTNTTPVDPEQVTQYELGAKMAPTNGVRINIAGYYTRQKDAQLTARDPLTGNVFLQNAASVEIYGGEIETELRPFDRFNLRGSVSLLHGKYLSFPNASVTLPATSIDPTPAAICVPGTGVLIGGNRSVICDVTGKNILKTPFFTATLGSDYTIPLTRGDIVLAGNLFYSGASYWDALNRLREKSYAVVNIQATWTSTDDRLQFGGGVDNLFNKYRNLSVVTSGTADAVSNARPVSWYVQTRLKF